MSGLSKKRRTKIVCTLGPASTGKVLHQMLEARMDVARLNFSHGTREEHAAWIRGVRQFSDSRGKPVAILQDLAGPKMRLGDLAGGQINLIKGQKFNLTTTPRPGQTDEVGVDYPEIVKIGRAHV